MAKYNRYREILIDYIDGKKKIIDILNKYEKEINNRNIKITFKKSKKNKVNLIGYDNTIKNTYEKFNEKILQDIFNKIDNMPMRSLDRYIRKQNGGNMRLYTDDIPKYTIKGTGFKNLNTAKKTINLIKNRSIIYQLTTVRALYYRAKYHPNRTEDMERAMDFYKKWIQKNKDKKPKYEYSPLNKIKKYDIKDTSFIKILEKYGKAKTPYLPIDKKNPSGLDYDSYRERELDKLLKNKKKLIDNNKPTKYLLKLISLAYIPKNIKKN